jgi:hypothetical protein
MKKVSKEKVRYMNTNLACMDDTALHKLYKDLQKANRMLKLQKTKLIKEKDAFKKWGEDLNLLNDLSKSLGATLDTDKIIVTAYTRMQEIISHDILSIVLFKQKKLWLFSSVKLNVDEIEEIKAAIISSAKEVSDTEDKDTYKMAVKYLGEGTAEVSQPESVRKKKASQLLNRLCFPMEIGGIKIGMLKMTNRFQSTRMI